MTMYYIYIFERSCPLEVDIERLENLLEMVVFRVQPQLARKAQSADIVFVFVLVAKAPGLDMAKFRKLLREELDVDTCTAVDFRREFVSKDSSVHNIHNYNKKHPRINPGVLSFGVWSIRSSCRFLSSGPVHQ